jgi:hypothetical protein
MNFRVHVPGGEDFYHEGSTYHIGDGNAVLTVQSEDGDKVTYSPSAWLRIEERSGDYDVTESVR